MKKRILFLLLCGFTLVTCKPLVTPPYLTGITPAQAATSAEITLQGELLNQVSKVIFGENGAYFEAAPQGQTEFSLRVVVPVMPVGPTEVRVFNEEGESNALAFTVLAPALVLGGFSPARARHGEIVTLTGENLDGITEVRFSSGASTPAAFKLEGVTLKVTVPDDARTGSICFKNSLGTFCTATEFEVLFPPNVTTLSPTQGVAGVEITLTGQHLSNARVYFDGREVAVKSNNGLILKVLSPTFNAVTTVAVKVVTLNGETTTRFTGAPQAEINAVYPAGLVPGSALTLKGKNFLDVRSVQFKNTSVAASEFILNTANSVTLRVPAGTQPGEVRIVHAYGAGKDTALAILRGPGGLTTDNLASGLPILPFGSLDSCAISLLAYCLEGKPVVFLQNSVPCNETYVSSEKIGNEVYEVYGSTRFNLNAGVILKAEKTGISYTGFVLLVFNNELFTGNLLKDGTIVLVSTNSGAPLKLCRALLAGSGTTLQGLKLPLTTSVKCGVCGL